MPSQRLWNGRKLSALLTRRADLPDMKLLAL
jgi:hypothetical protein